LGGEQAVDRTVAIGTPAGQPGSRALGEPGTQARQAAGEQLVVGDIPQPPPGFRPRAELLAKLDQAGAAAPVAHAVTGMPGTGKTQLVAGYARAKLAAGWRLVAWINAADAASLLAGLAAVADAARLSEGRTRRDAAAAGAAVRDWLEADGDRCLIVFDDAADPDVLRPFVPTAGAAHVLVTSSQQSAATLGASVAVDVFTAEEALALLTGPAGAADTAKAAALAAELGYLPLGLAQAAAVIAGHGLEHGTYLERLRAVPAGEHLADRDGHPSAAAAVSLSVRAARAADRTGVCARMLEIIAMLSEAGVRRQLLHAARQAGMLAVGGRGVPAATVDRALEWLSRRSLLTASVDGGTIVMHRLVARAVRDGLAERQRSAQAWRLAAAALEEHVSALAGSPDRPALRAVPLHVAALLDHMPGPAAADDQLADIVLRLRFLALYHLVELGDSAPQAIELGESLTADLERLLGPDHPDTLNSRNSLAAAYLAAGRPGDAILLFEQILAVWQRVLGPDHPDTVTSRNNLAAAYQDAGRVAEAIPLFEQNLAARQRLLGAGHPLTLNCRGNLAAAYQDAGRAAEAIPLLEQTLAGRERALGRDHPDTRTSRRNLITAYRDEGRPGDAILLFEQTFSGWPRVLRPEHPGTRGGQPLARAGAPAPPAGFRRPPADPARRVPPDGFRQPPADAEQDREIVAAIAAGDPAGIAAAYDRHAAAVYGYCQAMLDDPAKAAEALRDTFVTAAALAGGLRERPELRPWLYGVAGEQWRRLLPATPRDRRHPPGPQDATAGGAGVGQAELRTAIRAILAELKPREHEVIELSFRHHLHGPGLATALGMSARRADALASRARGRLGKALAALGIALAGRQACPGLGELLAGWDGRLTEETRDLVDWHVRQCRPCAARRPGELHPEALSALLPLAPLPAGLREQVLDRCPATAEDAVAYRRHAGRARFAWFSRAVRQVSWDGIRANPGAAIAAAAIALWLAAAASVLLLTFAGHHSAGAGAVRPSPGGAAAAATQAAVPSSAVGRSAVRRLPDRPRPPLHPSPPPTTASAPPHATSPSATP
jgi:DNA-directed RNA polymerase specialized sigma24 family protein